MRTAALISIAVLVIQAGAASGGSPWIEPDSFLYPFMVWSEKLRLNFILNQTERTQGMLELADERLTEAENSMNNTRAFDRAMEEYASQLEDLKRVLEENTANRSGSFRMEIKERIEDHKNRTNTLNNSGIKIIQQSIIEMSGEKSEVKVSVVNGNVSVYTEGGNATVTEDGGNVTVISTGNNSRQVVIVRSSGNQSSSSSVVVRSKSVSKT